MMWLVNIKGFLGAAAGNVLLPLAFAALVFAGGHAAFALLRRFLKFEGLRISLNVLLVFIAAAAFEHVAPYTWAPIMKHAVWAFIFIFGVYVAYCLLEHVFYRRLVRERGWGEMPRIVRDIIRLAVIVLAALFSLKAFMGFEPTALIATSTVLSAVIGLAMQDVLANIFAGISLQFGKPFRVGDWVTVYNQTGTVVSTSWRATRIKTRDNNLVEVANANIAKTEIYNYSTPTPLQRRHLEVGVVYSVPPNKVKRVLREAALAAPGVRGRPEPDVLLVAYGDFAITYRLRFWVDDFREVRRTEDKVMTNIWYYFKRADVKIPFPIRDVTIKQSDEAAAARAEEARLGRVRSFLGGVKLLAALGKGEREHLATVALERTYAAGEEIVRQGGAGAEFFLVVAGTVRTTIRGEDGRETEVGTFGPGFFFGEMSLLTGEPRRATVTAVEDVDVLVINKEHFRELIMAKPKVAERMSRAVARRRLELEQELVDTGDTARAATARADYSHENVLKRIKEFFNLG